MTFIMGGKANVKLFEGTGALLIKCLFWYQNKLKLKHTNTKKVKNISYKGYVVKDLLKHPFLHLKDSYLQ